MALDFAAGCLGGCAGVIVGHPFDTIKVRLQTQDGSSHRYKGSIDCFRSIIKTEKYSVSPAGCSVRALTAVPPKPSPGARLSWSGNAEEHSELFGIASSRGFGTQSDGAMAKKQAEANHGPPKTGRENRQAVADRNVARPSNEAPAAKRSLGRPPLQGVSMEPLAAKPIVTTMARKLRKAADATRPASKNPSTSKAVPTKDPRTSRRKRSRSSSTSAINGTASEPPKRRSAEGKMAGLYRGMSSPMAGVALVNAVVFGVYGTTQKRLGDSIWAHAAAGVLAGAVQSIISSPVELAKTRLQILKVEGLRGAFRGFGPTLLRDAPGFAVYFASYERMVRLGADGTFTGAKGTAALMAAGGLAGVFSWMACYPMDVLKSRLQVDGMRGPRRYKGLWDCAVQSYRQEGIRAFTRGLNSTLLRAFPTNAATFTCGHANKNKNKVTSFSLFAFPTSRKSSTTPERARSCCHVLSVSARILVLLELATILTSLGQQRGRPLRPHWTSGFGVPAPAELPRFGFTATSERTGKCGT
ncbi:hypothetical protein MTO96_028702 [Rhipicephalus appendiculatus]